MGGRDGSHPARASRLAAWLPVALVLAVLAAGVVAWRLDPAGPDPVEEPAAVPPPRGLSLPAADDPAPVAETTEDMAADPRAVRRAVRPTLRDPRLGRRVAVAVTQLSDGEVVYRSGDARVIPASTLKTLTTAAALVALGEDHRFRTTVVAGTTPRRIVLVGGAASPEPTP